MIQKIHGTFSSDLFSRMFDNIIYRKIRVDRNENIVYMGPYEYPNIGFDFVKVMRYIE